PVSARPAAVRPGADDEHVEGARIPPLDLAIDLERAEEVLRVEPSAHGHDGGLYALEMGPQVSRLPELVVRVVLHQLLPERDPALEEARLRVRERAELQVELVAIGRFEVERLGPLARGLLERLPKGREEAKRVWKVKRAVVVEV